MARVFLALCIFAHVCAMLILGSTVYHAETSWVRRAGSVEVSTLSGTSARMTTVFVAPVAPPCVGCGTQGKSKPQASTFPMNRSGPMATPALEGRRTVPPVGALDPNAVFNVNDWISAVAGGSVGVMGTLIQLEIQQERLKTRRNCPYCSGKGKIACAQCFCGGSVLMKSPGISSPLSAACPNCGGKKFVTCLNCRGDGRAVPRELDRKTSDAAEADLRLEEVGMSN